MRASTLSFFAAALPAVLASFSASDAHNFTTTATDCDAKASGDSWWLACSECPGFENYQINEGGSTTISQPCRLDLNKAIVINSDAKMEPQLNGGWVVSCQNIEYDSKTTELSATCGVKGVNSSLILNDFIGIESGYLVAGFSDGETVVGPIGTM